ncbi:MAG: NAD(P)-binding protein [Actinomycetota bacterium]|nr:NAD(P)-binding protein [Actinomycetota bacterium]
MRAIVVGAGLVGLAAASELHDAGVQGEIFEARDRRRDRGAPDGHRCDRVRLAAAAREGCGARRGPLWPGGEAIHCLALARPTQRDPLRSPAPGATRSSARMDCHCRLWRPSPVPVARSMNSQSPSGRIGGSPRWQRSGLVSTSTRSRS